MIVKTCEFVDASNVFKGYGLAWDLFINNDPNMTWGDNNRSMVMPERIIDALEDADAEEGVEANQVAEVIKRLKNIKPNIYVDLEN